METTNQFRHALTRLYQRFSALQRGEKRCFGVTMTQCLALELLDLEGPKTVRGLAESLGLDTTTVTRVVDVIERDGLVRRARDERKDRRLVFVSLTTRGKALAEKLEGCAEDYCRRILGAIPPNERRTILRALERLVSAIDGLPAAQGAQGAKRPSKPRRQTMHNAVKKAAGKRNRR